jgi:hypothetical protein
MRDIDNIIYKIKYIVNNYCDDTILKNHWLNKLLWFDRFNQNSNYYIAPELHNDTKWIELTKIINDNIKENNILFNWERKIIDIYTAKDNGEDIPNIEDN